MNPLPRLRSLGEIFDAGTIVALRAFARATLLLAACGAIAEVVVVPTYFARGLTLTIAYVFAAIAIACAWLMGYASLLVIYTSEASHVACTPAHAIARARTRFWPIAGTLVLATAIALCTYTVALVTTYVFGAAIQDAFHFDAWFLGFQIAIVVTVGIALLAINAIVTTFVGVAMLASVNEEGHPGAAIARAARRCLGRTQWRRALAVGLAWIGPTLALLLLATTIESTLSLSGVLAYAVRGIIEIPAAAIGLAWTVVFSLDARVRLEGFDLESTLAVEAAK